MAANATELFLGRPKNILRFCGVWLSIENNKNLRKFYKIYLTLVMLTQYTFVLFEIIYVVSVWGDIDAVSEASYLLFTQASVCYKTTVFLINKCYLVNLLAFMESSTFVPQSKDHEEILVTQSRKIKRLCLFFLTSAITTCTLWAMIPLFDDAGRRSFPFKIWMPVSTERSPSYELGYLYQMTSIYISALLFIAVDSVALSMIMFGCAQLDIIMNKVQKVQSSSLYSNDREASKKRIADNTQLFIECVKQYQAIVKHLTHNKMALQLNIDIILRHSFVNDKFLEQPGSWVSPVGLRVLKKNWVIQRFIQLVENSYHANIFFQLSGTVAIICNIGLRISIVPLNSVQFFSMLNYMVTMLSQLFLYCWCGNELTIRSEVLRDCLYQCPWYEQDHKFRRALRITMERMKRPIIFRAGHYISLSRTTFVAILRLSYSYFAVLNRVNDKSNQRSTN